MSTIEPLFIVQQFSHFVKITKLTPQGRSLLDRFLSKYVQKAFKPPSQWSKAPEPKERLYGITTYDLSEYRFHIGQFEHLKEFLFQSGYDQGWYFVDVVPIPKPAKLKAKMLEHIQLRDKQPEVVDFVMTEMDNDFHSRLITMPTGTGKAQPMDAKIRVPGGWAYMRDMKVGRDIIAWDGTVTQVTSVSPRSKRRIARVVFQDGRTVDCDLEHLWKVTCQCEKTWTRVINTNEIYSTLSLDYFRECLYVDLIKPEKTKDVDLPMKPYDLGVALGHIDFNKNISTFFDIDRCTFDDLQHYKALGLTGQSESSKFIPLIYLNSSIEQRIQLIQGLLEKEATIDSTGMVIFSTLSEPLAKGVQTILHSLGGIAKVQSKKLVSTDKQGKQTSYVVYGVFIQYETVEDLFTPERRNVLIKDTKNFHRNLMLGIEKVKFLDVREVQCISIDHPDRLYVTDGYVSTHNSVTGAWSFCQRGVRTAYIILPSYLEKTALELVNTTSLKEKDVMVVRGGDSLRGLIELGKTGQYRHDVVLISMKTWTLFIDAYINNADHCVESEYGCAPEELFHYLGIGTVLIDEIHQHLHAVYKTFCFMHQELAIGMSATVLSSDPFIENMQKMMFPREIRFANIAPKKYIRAYGISYCVNADHLNKLKLSVRGSTSYSQNAFEESITKHKGMLSNYLKLIKEVVDNGFMDLYKPGHKCIIYCYRIDMCDIVVNYLKQAYPKLDIRRYSASHDPYENLIDPDIRITTQKSAGTAHDIPGLMTNITLDNVDSKQTVLQCLGRLREPKEGIARYFSVYSESISKHMRYYANKKEIFKNSSVLSLKDFRSHVSL